MSGPGIVISSIDNMPAQLPRESTDLFGGRLLPYINDFVSSIVKSCSVCILLYPEKLKVDPYEPLDSQQDISPVIKDVSCDLTICIEFCITYY